MSADVVPLPGSESAALRVALARVEQDIRALQKALDRMQTDRDYWRDQYNKQTRETK